MIGMCIISIILLFFYVLGSTTEPYGTPQYGMALLITIVVLMFLSISPLIAHARHLVKRKTIYWLSFCWFIPFSWIIALCMAIFGKPEPIDNDNDESSQEQTEEDFEQEIVYNKSVKYETRYYNDQIQNNAIDRAFYKIGQSAKNAVSTVWNSKVVRGTVSGVFKTLLIIAIVIILAIIRMLIAEKNAPNYTNTYHNQQYRQDAITQPTSYTSRPATPQKSAEQIWFEQAAASMK